MARDYAQIKLSIWDDDDWRELSPLARYLYMSLLTSPSLNHCGVADWRPARIASLTGMSAEDVEAAGSELTDSLHLVIDRDAEEVMIRSFIRNDGLMKQPKMAVAMTNARASLSSQVLRGVVVHELKRLHEDYPDLKGWGSDRARELLGLRSINPSEYPLGKGSGKGKSTPSGKGSPTPAPTPAPSNLTPSQSHLDSTASCSTDAEREFDEWYSLYPRKRDKGHARKAYRTARKKVTAERLFEAVRQQGPILKSKGDFAPYPASWLNGERWEDQIESGDDAPSEPVNRWHPPEPPAEIADDPAAYQQWLAEHRKAAGF